MNFKEQLKRIFKSKQTKKYSSYEEYVNHQKEKTQDPVRRQKWLGEEWDSKLNYFENVFETIVTDFPEIKNGTSVGLGARTGQEVQAMINLGFKASGVDLVACKPLVIEGDIHDLPFENDSFDFAFTNIYDHSLYPDKFLQEIDRIVKSQGVILLHLAFGDTDDYGANELIDSTPIVNFFKEYQIVKDEPMPIWGGLNHQVLIKK